MDSSSELFEQLLRRAGYSITSPRRLVFNTLYRREPLSMHELGAKTKGRIDRASLYRITRIFEELGIVQRIPTGWKYKLELTDIFTHHHHHITCLGCSSIIPIKENKSIENLIENIVRKQGVLSVRHQLEVQGYCAKCQKNGKSVS